MSENLDDAPKATTRRGFLSGLFAGLAGVIGASSGLRLAVEPAVAAPKKTGPIDNIFEPIGDAQHETRTR